MPLIPDDIKKINFSQKDLFLDVKLQTITINQGGLDFTGRGTFNVGFFRNSSGFGITNIKVSTNASLQPTVEIEFKDLYGKTVFSESSQEGADYKAIFQWPPPKFKFTFKGYLGQPVTWMLNMKTTSTQFNADDGSYTIRATFIPNQWGMFADMPFLYLFAAKKLKADNSNITIGPNSSEDDLKKFQKETESIIDLMYVGKRIEVVKNKKTKDFQKTIDALNLLRRDPITGFIGGTFKAGDKITEITPENPNKLTGFRDITIALPPEYKDLSEGEVKDRLRSLNNKNRTTENIRFKLATALEEANKFLIGAEKVLGNFSTSEQNQTIINEKKELAKSIDGVIDENLKLIDEAIKGRIFLDNQEELKKLTISEVFKRIAGDAAYILGYMLDAGEQGYFNNEQKRSEAESKGDIIGRYFPLKWKKEEKNGESINTQVPAKDEYGIENFELKFVNKFIVAIAEGIAQNRALQAQNFDVDEDKIRHRVSNMEIISSNPFKNIIDWKEIASIIMKRASVAGYITQGSLVNAPGDYGNFYQRNNRGNNMRKMANGDVVNLDDSILAKLPPEDLESLKEFCSFWIELLDDPNGIKKGDKEWGTEIGFKGGNSTAESSEVNRIVVFTSKGNVNALPDGPIKTFFLGGTLPNFSVFSRFINPTPNTVNLPPEFLNAGFKAYTVEQYLSQFIGPRYLFFGRSTAQAIAGVGYSEPTLQSTFNFYDTLSYVNHFNNLTFIHHPLVLNDYYQFLVFEDAQDIQKLKEFQPGSNEGDTELTKTGDVDDRGDPEPIKPNPQSIIFIDDTKQVKNPNKPSDLVDSFEYIWWQKAFEGDVDRTTGQAALSFFTAGLTELVRTGPAQKKVNNNSFIRYSACKSATSLKSVVNNAVESSVKDIRGSNIKEVPSKVGDESNLKGDFVFLAKLDRVGPAESTSAIEGTDIVERTINVTKKPIAIVPYAQNWKDGKPCPTGGFFGQSKLAAATRAFLREYCVNLFSKIESLQDETSKIFGQILGKAGEHEDLLYQQMHNLFHQWQILALDDKNDRLNISSAGKPLTPIIAEELEKKFSKSKDDETFENSEDLEVNTEGDYSSGFIYSYPLQSRGDESGKFIRISESLINIEPLYNAKANTTVLNVLQQLCSKNNFMFFPIAGNSGFLNIKNLFEPSFSVNAARISNSFQILFHPTPESRTLTGDNEPMSSKFQENIEDFAVKAFPVSFGDPSNKIIKSVVVGTDDNKVTAESIVNLQRIVDNENKNKTVTTDCSLLSVFEGRSYKAKLSTLGNAQISPMQFFFLRNHAIFTGLYQIMKVDHNISPNDMTTEFEGIKMRYASGGYGGVAPVTLQDFREAEKIIIKNAPLELETVEGDLGQDIAFTQEAPPPSLDGSVVGGTTSVDGSGTIINPGSPIIQDGIQFIDYGAGNYLNHKWEGALKEKRIVDGKEVEVTVGGRPGQTSNFPSGKVDSIVIHWTAGWTLDGAISTLQKRGLHYHILIHENGEVHQISDLKKYAWHGGNANRHSIGISFAGGIVNTGRKNSEGKNVVDAYERTIEEWNSTEYKAKGNDRVTYNPKQQFAGIIQACILAKRAHPSIKFITGHQWVTTEKVDPGDSFPWQILLRKLREVDSSFNDVQIATPITNLPNQPNWLKGRRSQPKSLQGDIDVTINLSANNSNSNNTSNTTTPPSIFGGSGLFGL